MSHPAAHDDDGFPTLRPRPRRPFELSSTPPTAPNTPPLQTQDIPSLAQSNAGDDSAPPSRSRSILNLTSSTLFGIYQPTGYAADRDEPATPWGTGAMTPAESPVSFDLSKANIPDAIARRGPNGNTVLKRRKSTAGPRRFARKGFKGYYLPLMGRWSALFGVGILYGLLITHLHDRQEISPVKVEGLDRSGWAYLLFWGFAGVMMGEALPYIDKFWAADDDEDDDGAIEDPTKSIRNSRGIGAWNDVIRSVGLFVGIAFAIRKLPWQSTLQLSLTLTLANPAIWYIIDRSPPGFLVSTAVSIGGTALLLGINPALVPSPSPERMLHNHIKKFSGMNSSSSTAVTGDDLVLGFFSEESVGVATWIASVLFVSTVCFGNIGRRLAASQA